MAASCSRRRSRRCSTTTSNACASRRRGSYAVELTAREREVLKLIAEGNTNQDIADLLCLSRKTVETHRSNIMDKLDMHKVTDLVKYAIREGLVGLD